MPQPPVHIAAPVLQDFVTGLLTAGGFTSEEAVITAKSLVLSNMAGHPSHGVVKTVQYLSYLEKKEVVSGVPLTLERESDSLCVADAQLGLGQVQMSRLMDILLKKAGTHGFVSGTLRNSGHIGRLGEWLEGVTQAGMAGFITTNDNGTIQCVAPPGGKEPRTSTNPLAFGIPLPEGESFIIDLATSSIAVGKAYLSYLAGSDCAPGTIQDAHGVPTTDPSVLFKEPRGAILPMGGFKGFGLSMAIDCLAAGLSGGFTPPAPPSAIRSNNAVIGIWNPEYFSGLAHMQEQAAKYLDYIRQTPPVDPQHPVRIPGERAKAEVLHSQKQGILLDAGTVEQLTREAMVLGVAVPREFLAFTASPAFPARTNQFTIR